MKQNALYLQTQLVWRCLVHADQLVIFIQNVGLVADGQSFALTVCGNHPLGDAVLLHEAHKLAELFGHVFEKGTGSEQFYAVDCFGFGTLFVVVVGFLNVFGVHLESFLVEQREQREGND